MNYRHFLTRQSGDRPQARDMITIYATTPDPARLDTEVLASFFSTERGQNDTSFLHRRRNSPQRGFLRILIPKFLVKVKANDEGVPRYRLRPDGVATLFYFVFGATSIAALAGLSDTSEYPWWMPLPFFAWYIFRAVIEILRTKAAFDRATNGLPLGHEQSDLVTQVLALHEAEQRNNDDQ